MKAYMGMSVATGHFCYHTRSNNAVSPAARWVHLAKIPPKLVIVDFVRGWFLDYEAE